MKHAKFMIPLVLLGLVLVVSAAADDKKATAERVAMDSGFLAQAAQAGMHEIELSEYAKTQATSQAVKDLANSLVTDHTKVNDELKQLMPKVNVEWPTPPTSKIQEDKDHLAKYSGAEFDKAYLRMMIRDHKQAIDMFEREAKHAENSDVKNFASGKLPALKGHLKMAEDAQLQVK